MFFNFGFYVKCSNCVQFYTQYFYCYKLPQVLEEIKRLGLNIIINKIKLYPHKHTQ